MSEEPIDLRGTQGSVVLPHGTVVQNYPPATTSSNHHMEEPRVVQEHTVEIALLKNDVADNKSQIRELWATMRHIELLLRPKTMDATLFFVGVLMAIAIVVASIYIGGNWG